MDAVLQYKESCRHEYVIPIPYHDDIRIWCMTCSNFVYEEECESCGRALPSMKFHKIWWELHSERITRLEELVDMLIIKLDAETIS